MVATFERSAAGFRVPMRQPESNHTIHKLMEIKKNKELYDAPSMLVFEVKQEGVICASPGQAGVQDYNWNNVDEE